MSHTLFETVRRIVREELGRVRTAELAVVQEQHPHADDSDSDNYACTVALRNNGVVLNKVPVATAKNGVAAIPGVGDLVLVQFLDGDVNAPVIIGTFYNDEDRPPANADGQAIVHLPPGGADAEAVHLELESVDARRLALKLGDALAITLVDDDPVIEIDVDGGKAAVRIARDGSVEIESQGDLSVKAQGKVAIEGSEINVEAQGQLNLKGATINLN